MPPLFENPGSTTVTTLKEQKIFKACILVAKYSANIDQQYRDTIKYYATLLPDLFSQNCLIVLTDNATDERSQAIRIGKGYDHDTIIENVRKEIKESSGICIAPIVFSIDCVPVQDEEVQQNKRVRDIILSYIFSLKEVHMTEFLVAKTKIIKDEDREEIYVHQGNIEGYCERLKEMNPDAKEALDGLKSKEERITTIKISLIRHMESLAERDSDNLVEAHVWSVDDTWKFFRRQEKKFDEISKFEVFNVTWWTNGYCQLKIIREGNRIHGFVRGQFMRGMYARITMETKKKICRRYCKVKRIY